ncbi:MAG: molybdopterin-dependent oxidoreductase [Candidatus Adiutrix sp.]|jgi:aldehyde oxidoreductase|nr:molybdopterin-dependent oxidoreductase [Candidatus Adiutrix sp.]
MIQKQLIVNGVERNLFVNEDTPLSTVLREQLFLTGTKIGCGEAQCGACTVLVDGKPTFSCVTKVGKVAGGAKVTTIEGIGTPDRMHALQKAWVFHGGAQCGFCSPGFIVSASALLAENPFPTREDVREWFQKHRNVCRCTGYIPLVDAVIDAAKVLRGEKKVETIEFKDPADGRIWASNRPRPTAVGKVTGTLDYGADLGLKLPADKLYLAMVQAEVSHANIKSIDTSAAEKMPGVVKVVTHKDVEANAGGAGKKGVNRINGLAFPANKGDGLERPILCDKKVFQYGDCIAVVCADTLAQAQEAAKAVKVDLEVLPAYLSAPAAKAPDAIEIHPGTPNHYFTCHLIKGQETAPIFAKSDVVTVENDFVTSRQPHLPIEPDVALGFYNEKGQVVIHCKSIGVHLHKLMIEAGLGLEGDQLVLVSNPMGGTFGYKFSPTIEAIVASCVIATKRPCFLNFNYHQQQQYTGKRSPFHMHIKLAADKKGKFLAMEGDYDVDHGPYSEFGDLVTVRGIQFMAHPYKVDNIRTEGRTICTNHGWGSAFRGYGGPQANIITETAIDQLAAKLGIDPLEIRYINALRPGDVNVNGQEPDSYQLVPMIEKLRPIYEAAKKKAAAESTATHKKGVGVAAGTYGCGLDGPDSGNAAVELNPDNTITVITAWQDHGQGADQGAITTAHETFYKAGVIVDPDKMKFTWADTRNPVAGPAGGSRSQVMVGGAVRVAAEAFIAGLQKGNRFLTYEEAQAAGKPTRYDGTFSVPGVPNDEKTGLGKPFMVYMWGVCLAEVTVELATGKTTCDGITFMVDCGKIVNKLVIDGQIWGGVAQAIGLALTEDFEDIQKHKTMRGAGIPYIKDIPDKIDLHYFESPREFGPHGAAGCGEIPLCVPHSAVINALNNAIGAQVHRIPAYPERVLEAIKSKK